MVVSITDVWSQILDILRDDIKKPSYESWIKPIKFVSLEDNILTLSVHSKFAKDWLIKNYYKNIQKAINTLTDNCTNIDITVDEKNTPEPQETSVQHILPINSFHQHNTSPHTTTLNAKYTFDTFIVGDHNKFSHAAAMAVAKKPAKAHNPLFIYSGVGLGKTHLMNAIGHYIKSAQPHLNVMYTTTEHFTNELINSIRTNKMQSFRSQYRKVDVLLIDDIQFIEGKDMTQEEIFHTFNTLYESGSQIVISSDRSPKNIATLEDRLRSRFEWGLIADMQAPNYETRLAILTYKIEQKNIIVPYDILELIANNYPHNIRELEGALHRVLAYANLTGNLLTLETAMKVIGVPAKPINITVEKIINATCEEFHLTSGDLKGNSRQKNIVHARHVAIYLVRELMNLSFPSIGQVFGGRKHTTILYAYEKFKETMKQDSYLATRINTLIHAVQS